MRRLMEQMKQREGLNPWLTTPMYCAGPPPGWRRRSAAGRDERELLRRQTYAREPRLAQLDRRLQGTMAELVAASLRKGENAGDAVRAIRDKNLELQQERAVLLGALGLPEDALDDKPACPKCGDTGWRGAQMCDCLRSLCTQEQIRELSKLLDLGSSPSTPSGWTITASPYGPDGVPLPGQHGPGV